MWKVQPIFTRLKKNKDKLCCFLETSNIFGQVHVRPLYEEDWIRPHRRVTLLECRVFGMFLPLSVVCSHSLELSWQLLHFTTVLFEIWLHRENALKIKAMIITPASSSWNVFSVSGCTSCTLSFWLLLPQPSFISLPHAWFVWVPGQIVQGIKVMTIFWTPFLPNPVECHQQFLFEFPLYAASVELHNRG